MKTPSILVVGSINMDLVLKTERMPRTGESFIGQQYHHIPGGKGANQAVAAARLGGQVTLLGRLGFDADGFRLKEYLEKQRISTDFVAMDEKSQSGLAVIILDASGQNSIIVYPGANMDIQKAEVQRVFAECHCDVVMLQLEIPRNIVIESCRLAREKRIPAILDAGPAQTFPLEEVHGLEILTPNETETLALTGIECKTLADADRAARVLAHRSGARAVVIKLGAQGALLFANRKTELFPGHRVEVVDTTAAGDAFTAAMVVKYVQTGDLAQAIRYGNLAGAVTVTRLGAQPSLPTDEEVATFARSLRREAREARV
jgi:ribokinase